MRNATCAPCASVTHAGWVRVEPIRPAAFASRPGVHLAGQGPSGLACPAAVPVRPRRPARRDRRTTERAIAVLAGAISGLPGLRVPGCVDGFEMAVRAILGQRISVPAATTLAGRLAAAFGEPIETPFPSLDRLSPTTRAAGPRPSRKSSGRWASPRRAHGRSASWPGPSVERLIVLEPGADPDAHDRAAASASGHRRLDRPLHRHARPALARRLPGRRPRLAAGRGRKPSPGELARRAESWRPWRSYAAIVLWNSLSPSSLELPIHGQDRCITGSSPARSVSCC